MYTKAAKDSLPIIHYFTKQPESEAIELVNDQSGEKESNEKSGEESDEKLNEESDKELNEESDEELDESENEIDDDDFSKKMEDLEVILHQSKKKISVYDSLRHRSIYEFFINWKKEGMTRKNAALDAAKKVYDKGSYRAKIINKWARSWIENGVLPVSLQGCHQKVKSFIDDEDVIEKSLEFIREKEGKITPKLYRTFINDTLFSQMGIIATISEKTSRVWLKKLGFILQSRKKGIYFDGYERSDVLEYRSIFLKKMEEFEQLMPIFEGDNMDQRDPVLPNEEKLHIFVTHDECLFYANQ